MMGLSGGQLTPFTCPECHGTLLQLKEAQKRAELVRRKVMQELPPSPEDAQEDSPGAAGEVQ